VEAELGGTRMMQLGRLHTHIILEPSIGR
jgi:hypothetical protein